MEWQPIETAPKGELLLYFPETAKGRIHLVAMYRIGYVESFPYRQPTHWMSLPEPPK